MEAITKLVTQLEDEVTVVYPYPAIMTRILNQLEDSVADGIITGRGLREVKIALREYSDWSIEKKDPEKLKEAVLVLIEAIVGDLR